MVSPFGTTSCLHPPHSYPHSGVGEPRGKIEVQLILVKTVRPNHQKQTSPTVCWQNRCLALTVLFWRLCFDDFVLAIWFRGLGVDYLLLTIGGLTAASCWRICFGHMQKLTQNSFHIKLNVLLQKRQPKHVFEASRGFVGVTCLACPKTIRSSVIPSFSQSSLRNVRPISKTNRMAI